MDHRKISEAISLLLEGLGEDTGREGVLRTPERFAAFCEEIFYGYDKEPPEISLFWDETGGKIISMENISFTSFCEHHLVPFYGTVSVSYKPKNGKICGFGDIPKVCNYFASRLQLQERLTSQIGDFLAEKIDPEWIKVEMTAQHFCIRLHGSLKESASVTTIYEK
jgi:GTP cyclohydrolase I